MKYVLLLTLLLASCATTDPVVEAKLEDLNRRVLFLYEQQRRRQIAPIRCQWFSGPDMQCGMNEDGACMCRLVDDGWGIALPVEEAVSEKDEVGTEQEP